MPFYETVFVLEPTLAEEQTEAKLKDVQSIIEQNDGTIRKIERWGMRKLAYPIKHKREGTYFLIEFESDGGVVDDLEKHYRIQEFILRYLTLRRENPSEENYVSPLSRLAETRESVPEEEPVPEAGTPDESPSEPVVDIEEGIREGEEQGAETVESADSDSKELTSPDGEETATETGSGDSHEEKSTKEPAESGS